MSDNDSRWRAGAELFVWQQSFDAVRGGDGRSEWFTGGTIDASASVLDRKVEGGHGDDEALVIYPTPGSDAPLRLTYAALLDSVARLAGYLRGRGLEHGQYVNIVLPQNDKRLSILTGLALQRLGVRFGYLFGMLPPMVLGRFLTEPSLTGVIYDPEVLAEPPGLTGITKADIEEGLSFGQPAGSVPIPAEYPTMVLFTSGTTSVPKLALQGHAGFQVAVLDALVIAEQDARTAEEFEVMAKREGADRGITSPAVFGRMKGTSDLQFQFALIGERMSAARWMQIFAMFPRARVRNGFGANEVGLLTSGPWFGATGNADAFNASEVLPWVEHEVVEQNDAGEGKLCVRTSLPTVCRGFLGDDDGYRARLHDGDALFETGDVVKDEGKSFAMVGRSDNLLKIRSRFLDPAIVEQLCMATDGVEEAKLIAHEGEAHLFLVGDEASVDGNVLADSLAERAGAHARPATVRFVEVFERTPSGKIKEGALRALVE